MKIRRTSNIKCVDDDDDDDDNVAEKMMIEWSKFDALLTSFTKQVNAKDMKSFCFWFQEGVLIKAIQSGDWVSSSLSSSSS